MTARARRRRRLELVDWRKVGACPITRRQHRHRLATVARIFGLPARPDWRYPDSQP